MTYGKDSEETKIDWKNIVGPKYCKFYSKILYVEPKDSGKQDHT